MAANSKIEWTEQTWNPIVGCSIVSPGCTNCYAMKMAARIEAMSESIYDKGERTPPAQYCGTTKKVNGNAVWTGEINRAPRETLLAPLSRKKPTTYFVNSMGDLFHEDVPDEWIDEVFAVMALAPQHTFQVLTKRAARMSRYLDPFSSRRADRLGKLVLVLGYDQPLELLPWPLPNVWLGVSTERQQEASERIPLLLGTQAAVRFISAEPLLGPINLTSINHAGVVGGHSALHDHGFGKLDWVIVGGESGPDARPMHPDWARHLRDCCKATDVPFFFKQWGNWHPEIDRDQDDPDWRQPYTKYREPHFQILNLAGGRGFHGERVHVMRYCSKKSAGRELDGKIHDAMPPRVAHGKRPAHG